MSVCSVMKLVHESARIARQAVYCTVVLHYGTVGEVDQDIPEQYVVSDLPKISACNLNFSASCWGAALELVVISP